MKRLSLTAALVAIVIAGSAAKAEEPVAITSLGWTIVADQSRGVLSISQDNLGMVLDAVRINLQDGHRYVVFDFWNQKLLGVFSDAIQIDIEGHDTRVLLIHPLLNRPRLIANSRHVSAAYSHLG